MIWLAIHINFHFRTSLFFKGPMLSTMSEFSNNNVSPASFHKIKIYKNNIKSILLDYQSKGDDNEWLSLNNILDNVPGLRRSNRTADILET